MNVNVSLRIVIFMTFAISLCIPAVAEFSRIRYMGSSCFSIPTGYSKSEMTYISDDGHSATFFSQQIMGRFIEFSLLRHMSDIEKGKNVMNLKLNFLEEDKIIPNIVWGVSDFNRALGSKIFYFAGSKSIEVFGCTLHGGFYKDPVSTRRKSFYGVEKIILPLISIAGEKIDDQITVGFKLRPYPGVSVEYAKSGISSDMRRDIYKLMYLRSFE